MGFIHTHLPCPDCGSRDALAISEDKSTHCFSCGKHTFADDLETVYEIPTKQKKSMKQPPLDSCITAISDRRIAVNTCAKYGVTQADDGTQYYPYRDDDDNIVAYKQKTPDKKFTNHGSWSDSEPLFGMRLFPKGSAKGVTLVEGEADCLAAYQMLGSKWPVVSVKNGASSALSDVKAAFEWLDSFENITIAFDNDAPGKEATKKVAELFGGKAKVLRHNDEYKDACDYLKNRAEADFVNRYWQAELVKPEGIVSVADILDRALKPAAEGLPWCFPSLTKLTYGRRAGELYGFGAGVGIGKTDVFTQQIAYDIDVLNTKVGVIYLEQNVVETAQRVTGKLDQRLYHVPDADWTREQYVDSLTNLSNRQQMMMMDHWGAMDWKTVKTTIRYFAKAYDIKIIYLDHLTALSANEADERRALDGIMADMASLAQQDGLIIHFISHLTTPEGKSHEEGGRVMEKHFTGSRAIARWAHYMFGLERNKQHEDPVQRQITTLRILKDRFTGRSTGEKIGLFYDKHKGVLNECELIDEQDVL